MRFLIYLGKILSYILTPRIMFLWEGCVVYLRSGYYSRFFKNCGKHVILCRYSSFEGQEYISIGNNVCVGSRTVITAWRTESGVPDISIDNGTNIGDDCHITASNRIIIGEGTLLGKKVTITDNAHGSFNISDLDMYPHHRPIVSKGQVIIGKRVWIGDKVTILPNVTIGDSAIIGANSVVTHDIPSYSVAVGNPAKVLKTIQK